uniref:CCAAT-box binding factor HAP3-like protein n=1 Tax=Selaginella sinensis TaxID=137174 RepID=A9P3Y3_9TRAC|nr:CCAAT-box binding factor HAP3-like protein [Selaginella sinensis]
MMMMMADAGSPNSQDSSRNSDSEMPGSERDSVMSSCSVREQDRFMPIANVIRIMRKVLPAHAKISDDAKETIQECVSEFISFITSEANDKCQREQRKTITAEDVLWAMSKLGFDDYVDPLTLFLHKYREVEGDHRGSIRGEPLLPKKPPSSSSSGTTSTPITTTTTSDHQHSIHPYGAYYKDSLTGATLPFVPDPYAAYK